MSGEDRDFTARREAARHAVNAIDSNMLRDEPERTGFFCPSSEFLDNLAT